MTDNVSVQREEVQRLLDLLRSHAAEERIRGARSLQELGVRTRGAVRTRGTVQQPASKPVPELDLSPALEGIRDASWEVRREVALALGEWADEVALGVLGDLAGNDPEWRVREAVAEALARIGGAQAVELLTLIVKTDPHPAPSERALSGLGDLALATWPEQLGPGPGPPSRPVRTRGAVRVRGASPSRQVSPQADAILALLDDVRFQHPSQSVREAAENALARLDEA